MYTYLQCERNQAIGISPNESMEQGRCKILALISRPKCLITLNN